MYSKQEASIIRQQFWTSFGQYLAPIAAASGNKINWINYKTGIRNVNFKMDVSDHAYIGIELSHNDKQSREIYFKHFLSLRTELESVLTEKWDWEETVFINGKQLSRICCMLPGVSIFNRNDWPTIISFLKPRIILLDEFWNSNKDIIEMLG